MENRKFFSCSCFTEGVVVSDYLLDDDNPNTLQLELSLWHLGQYKQPRSIWDRLRWCWHILWHGDLWADQVVLTPEEARKLGRYLLDKGNYSLSSDP